MALVRIRLTQAEWEYDPAGPLGKPGGFGAVYVGRATDGRTVAIKRLHIDRLGVTSREIEVAKFLLGHLHPHIIGMLDVGRDRATDAIFLVMERAQQSLQNLINESAPIATTDALEIIDAIAAGLEEIGELVHRDLKPDNVLLHNGVWKLADLGLARFVAETTAPNTMKGFLSAPYAAPEQWRMERVTKATDIYALGAILYALLTGRPPFEGPSQDDYSHQHQYEKPPKLKASSAIRQLYLDCLAKAPLVRPSLSSLRSRVQKIRVSLGVASPGSILSAAAAAIAEKNAQEEAETLQKQKTAIDRESAAIEAKARLTDLLRVFTERVQAEAPNLKIVSDPATPANSAEAKMVLGSASLEWKIFDRHFSTFRDKTVNWDILVAGYVAVRLNRFSQVETQGRSANLVFGKLNNSSGYRLWEVSLFVMPKIRDFEARLAGGEYGLCPFGLVETNWENPVPDRMLSHLFRLAENPIPIDGEFEDSFFERWSQRLGMAAQAGAEEMPLDPFHPPPPIKPISSDFMPYPGYADRYADVAK